MTRTVYGAFAWFCLLVVAGTVGRAQTPVATSTAPATLVAVIDIAKVFESHPSFKANLELLQQQAKRLDEDLEMKKNGLTQRGQKLADLRVGSPDYRQLESELARQLADLQVESRQSKKDLLQREALHYYSSYQEIIVAIERIAQRHGIGLVLRFDSRELDPQDPQSIMQGLNRGVILQRNLDITSLVIDDLRHSLAANAPVRDPRR